MLHSPMLHSPVPHSNTAMHLAARSHSPSCSPQVRIWRELERRVFKLLNTSKPFPLQLRHRTPRGIWIGGIPADALLYDQNVLDWNLVGELTGDREYIGRGFVPEARTLNDSERAKIQWDFGTANVRCPATLSAPGGVYSSEYTLRTLKDGAAAPAALPLERMIKAPPWLFSAESDVYKVQRATRSAKHAAASGPRRAKCATRPTALPS
jgi:hypothetical protein